MDIAKQIKQINNEALLENIKYLLYKNDKTVFEYLDFSDNKIYSEPLLNAYFNNNDVMQLNTITYGYIEKSKRPNEVTLITNNCGIAYLPNIGWFHTDLKNCRITLKHENDYKLTFNNKAVKYKFEEIEYLSESNIEIIKYSLPILDFLFYDFQKKSVKQKVKTITHKFSTTLKNSLKFIEEEVPDLYILIQLVTKKILIFYSQKLGRNSFASYRAHGVAFLNAYQEDYNEVFFIDDIAHQTGHIIFFSLVHQNIYDYFKIDPSEVVQTVIYNNEIIEERDLYTMFHAIYTYYTTFKCLDKCYFVFNGEKKHETIGRIKFYLIKCKSDLYLMENSQELNITINDALTKKGISLFLEIKNTYKYMEAKYLNEVENLDLSNQPYNFTFSKFKELNSYLI